MTASGSLFAVPCTTVSASSRRLSPVSQASRHTEQTGLEYLFS